MISFDRCINFETITTIKIVNLSLNRIMMMPITSSRITSG